jgi:hypothetical protein
MERQFFAHDWAAVSQHQYPHSLASQVVRLPDNLFPGAFQDLLRHLSVPHHFIIPGTVLRQRESAPGGENRILASEGAPPGHSSRRYFPPVRLAGGLRMMTRNSWTLLTRNTAG